MSRTPVPNKGCFKSSYPSTAWQEVPCAPAPRYPNPPVSGNRQPNIVGNGSDYAAQGSAPISSVVGSFDGATGVTSEAGKVNGQGPEVANAFTLQLNTNQFTTAKCIGAANPANCLGWQQFVFSNTQCTDSNNNPAPCIFIEYWLLNYGSPCPATDNWIQTSQGCFINKGSTLVDAQPISNLGQLSLTGKVAGGTDTVILSTATGDLVATAQDSILNLGQNWTAAEFSIANGTINRTGLLG